jgi:hypothetical protein
MQQMEILNAFTWVVYWNMSLILCRLTEHEACEKLCREIMEQLTLRSREPKTSQAYARISSAIRLRMKQYSSEVQQLKDKLSEASVSHAMYPYHII